MKTFTLEEARSLLPELLDLLRKTNEEFDELAQAVRDSGNAFLVAEQKLERVEGSCGTGEEAEALRNAQREFEQAFQEHVRHKEMLMQTLDSRLEEISAKGVILRNLREGLVDFPAEQNGFEYFLCWKMDEPDIEHWHLTSDGMKGRRPLICLLEYC